MKLKIIKPDSIIYEGKIKKATFPGSEGTFQILHNHGPMISTLATGKIIYEDLEGKLNDIEIKEGVLQCKQNEITVLIES